MSTLQVPGSGLITATTFASAVNAVSGNLATMVAGSTAPTTSSTGLSSLSGVWWHDTSSNTIKLRDVADTTWIVIGTLDEAAKTFVAAGSSGSYTLPTASTTTLGGVKVDGSTITINGSGVISAAPSGYTLPIASTTTLGGIKPDGTSFAVNGTTGVAGVVFGTTAGTAAQGNDARIAGALSATTAASTYAPIASPVFTGSVTIPSGAAISGYALSSAVPLASTSTPAALGTAAAGSSTAWSRGDHVHGMPSLDALSDASTGTKAAGDLLRWTGATWSNASLSTAGIQPAGTYLGTSAIPAASGQLLGGSGVAGAAAVVTVGSGLTLSAGTLTAGVYALPTASTTTLGGVKIDGTSITIASGVISAAAYVLPAATSVALGGVKPDGTTITNTGGAISVTYGTTSGTAAQGNDARITGALSATTAASTYAPLANPSFIGTVYIPVGASIAGYATTASVPVASSTTPAALGTAAVGVGTTWTRADHVHQMPALDVLANVSIASKASSDLLQWTGTAWSNRTLGAAGIQPAGPYITSNQSITLSGDATGIGATAITVLLSASGVASGTYNNSATAVSPLTIDTKGRITSVGAAVTITPAFSSVTGKPTTATGYGIASIDDVPIGATSPSTGKFLSLGCGGTVSGSGFNALFASPPSIGGTVAANGTFVTLNVLGSATIPGYLSSASIPAASGQLLGGSGTAGTAAAVTVGTGLALATGTLSVSYGISGSTAAAGNDSRIVNALSTGVAAAIYAPLASPTFTGVVTIPAGAAISGYATTASVPVASSTTPSALGTAAVGTGTTWARSDHVHGMPALDALANVTIATKATSDLIQWSGTAWVNKTIAGAGLQPAGSYITGNQTVTLSGDATGSGATAIAVTLAASGVTAGTYNSSATTVTPFTVDAKGRITGTSAAVTITPAWTSIASKPTTATGYGISSIDAVPVGATTPSTGAFTTLNITTSASIPGYATTSSVPTASVTTPASLGTAAVGVGTTWARADHIHGMPAVDSLSNVTITTKATSDLLQWTGTTWANRTIAGAGLQPAGSYLSANQTITLSGDASGSGATAISVTLAASGVTSGTYESSATSITPLTIDAKGRITATGAAVTITPAFSSITGKPTTSGGYGITAIDSATIGATTPSTGSFTTLSSSTVVSGAGFITYLASPPAIGGTAPAAGAFTTLAANSTVSGTGFSAYLANPPAIGSGTAAAGSFTVLTVTTSASIPGYATTASVPVASSTTPSALGTAAVGVGTTWARADHVHAMPAFASILSKPTTATGYGIASIDAVPIGATTASTGSFTTLTATTSAALGSAATATTPATTDNSTKVATTAFVKSVVGVARVDHYIVALTGAAQVVTFSTDAVPGTAAPFTAGPRGFTLPHISGVMINANQGDQLSLTSLSLSAVTVQINNGGVLQVGNGVSGIAHLTVVGI